MLQLNKILSTSDALRGHSSVTQITGGLSHQCFKVEFATGLEPVFLKIFSNHCPGTIAWEQQLQLQRLAAAKGFCPTIIEASDRFGYIITEYLTGEPIQDSTMPLSDKIHYAVNLIKHCQQLPAAAEVFNPQLIFDTLINNINIKVHLTSEEIVKIKQYWQQLIQSMNIDEKRFVLSHGDVNFSNIFVANKRAWLIDWEYNVLAEPEYDVGMCFAVNQVSASEHMALLIKISNSEPELALFIATLSKERVTRYFGVSQIINALWYLQASSEHTPTLPVSKINQQKELLLTLLNP